jgi:hypothetical protein
VKHVSGAQLTGTRAHGEERCQAALPSAGGFASPGKPYPRAASSQAARGRVRTAATPPPRPSAPRANPDGAAVRRGRSARGGQGAVGHPAAAVFLPGKGSVASLQVAASEEHCSVREAEMGVLGLQDKFSLPPFSPSGVGSGVTKTMRLR